MEHHIQSEKIPTRSNLERNLLNLIVIAMVMLNVQYALANI